MNNAIPRSEYPRPQLVRDSWLNLNGPWQFQLDYGRSGRERKWMEKEQLDSTITVPFCPESVLSGIGHVDFIPACWYRRNVVLTAAQLTGRTVLRFEAVNHFCEVWVNGAKVGGHTGGYTPFSFDVTDLVREGENSICLYVENDVRDPLQPRGKQCEHYYSQVCDYTRVTGIWQTVWLEFVPETYIDQLVITPDEPNDAVHVEVRMAGSIRPGTVSVTASYEGRTVGTLQLRNRGQVAGGTVALSERHLWEPLDAKLYDLAVTVESDNGAKDSVESYFGLRSVSWDNKCIYINGKPVFQRLVLDQGFYPDGIYTAPTDEALRRDIELSMELGFNGARLHQKIFERRFLYWADRLGYMVWGEYGDWGLNMASAAAVKSMAMPVLEEMERDRNSPALVGWCPLNEVWHTDRNGEPDRGAIRSVYEIAKAMDATRPVIDASGGYHVVTDIYDVHTYEQDAEKFAAMFATDAPERFDPFPEKQSYGGQAYMVSEYGGIQWAETESGWGYGTVESTKAFVEKYNAMAKALLECPYMCALCYTQLYDVEQEQNGLYTYERKFKFTEAQKASMRAAMEQKAAIEG